MNIPNDLLLRFEIEYSEVRARMNGMVAENLHRKLMEQSPAYGEGDFALIEEKYRDIRTRMEIIGKL
jgi:hypothetical protein